MSRFAILLLAMTALTACKGAPQFPVEVSLEIEGQSFEYTSSQGEFDDQGGPLSVYLLPDDFKDGSSPYACLRFYSGNPVGHFWVRYSAEGEEAGVPLVAEDADPRCPNRLHCPVHPLVDGLVAHGFLRVGLLGHLDRSTIPRSVPDHSTTGG